MSALNAISLYTYAITSPLNNILHQFISFILHKLIKKLRGCQNHPGGLVTLKHHIYIDFNQPHPHDIEIYSLSRNMDFY